ncbi:hypothetical protein M8C21_012074 [Ambrosia artemisiifolia]|uniref:NB-ARC domain-containing protein n=1 Tax=Ambrosia artemisiifolia TaxID=4212 RepID=A0AAD5CTU4_AMBAR|nr:hypothetical protein M8C21_012074 [Ambrosia artemisiifolia]
MDFFFSSTKHVTNMTEKLTELNEAKGVMEEKKNDALRNDQFIPDTLPGTHAGPSTSETAHDYDVTRNIFPSRLSIFNDVLKSLEHDSETQMMAICGMGGVEQTGLALSEDTIDARADRLRNRFEQMLKGGENILVIMDDVWEAINLKDIGLASPIPKGFKLLVTSRIEKDCIKMDIETKSIFKMVGLEEQEANSFFWETVRISYEDSERCTIGKAILNKCGGLPIAIKTIALALRSEDVYAWQVAQMSLQRHNLEDIEDLDGVVYNIFDISYEHLKKDEDKAIFVLCGLYPDDFDIPLEELLRYGWGLRLFKSAYTIDEARKRTYASVSNLIGANLLTESYPVGCVKMHDLARAFVLSNISKYKQASIVNHGDKSKWPTKDTRESCERILLVCKGMYDVPEDFDYPNLALLKLMNADKEFKLPEVFYKRMEKLEVLAHDHMRNPLLLVSLQCSFNLRTLCLHSCSLVDNDISFVGDLVNLEVLSIAHCHIQKLPSTIRQLKMLKLLDLTGCIDLCIDDGVLRCLEKLEELYMRCSDEKPIRFTNANCDELETLSRKLYALDVEFYKNILEPKRISFTKLQKFRISMGCFLKKRFALPDDIYSSTLKLVTNRSNILECNFSELFSKTEELHLSVKDMNCVEDIAMPLSQHSTFCMLKVLCVFKCVDLTHLFTIPTANGLKQLRSLKVSSCPVLKSLVSSSDRLNLMELPQLVELELNDLPDFTSIFPENNVSTTHPLFNKEVVFPKLSIIKIVGLKKLTHIWACEVSNGEEDNVSKLREIEVIDCDCLVNLFPRNPMRILSHLEELKVQRCSSIEVLFNMDLGKIEQLKCSSKLRRILCDNLEELTEVWRINAEKNPDHLICGFQAVETIRIDRCKKFRNVFTPAASNFDFGALKDITIKLNSGEELEV